MARAFPDSPEKRLNGFLVAKIQDLLQSFTLRFKLLNEDVVSEVESRKGGGGGLGGDKKGGYGMLAMAMMMKGAMGAMGKKKKYKFFSKTTFIKKKLTKKNSDWSY
jgi:Protein of unknown function (DUF1676)